MPSLLQPLTFDSSSRKGVDKTIGTQSGNITGQANSAIGNRSSEFGSLLPQFQGLVNSPGYSDAEKSGIEQGTVGAIQSSYGSAANAAKNRLARTGNSAGYGSLLGSLARGKGKDVAQQELDNQKSFADEQLRRKMLGLQGIASLYGIDTSFLSSLNSQQNQLAGLSGSTYATVKNHPGLGDSFMSSLGGAFGGGLGRLLTGG